MLLVQNPQVATHHRVNGSYMKHASLILIVCLIMSTASAVNKPASNNGGREAFYRCRDAQGQPHFGDSVPPECIGLDTEVLSDRGSVIRVIDGTKTLTEKAARKSEEEAAAKAKTDAEMRDRMLLDTYLSVSDIERLRDQRIDLVKGQLMIDQQTLEALMVQKKTALQQVLRFSPYNTASNAHMIPDNMVADMVTLANGIDITQQRITSKQSEMQDLQTKFTNDIIRFKELKGLK